MIRSRYKPTRVTKTGRTILSDRHYAAMRSRLYVYQQGLCFMCSKFASFEPEWFNAHHHGERGMGGSRRDDVPWIDDPEAVAMVPVMKPGRVYGLCAGPDSCHDKVDKKKLHWTKQV